MRPDSPTALANQGGPGRTELAARAELAAAGRVKTALGEAALICARWIDDSAEEPGSGVAAMSREFLAAMDRALAGAAPDELAERRRERWRG